ncbi:MAG: dephospho-CoA kinase [Planctomycetes bacterium]|nr:dephospho-CoA kinase [Planctomycetota bacterium]
MIGKPVIGILGGIGSGKSTVAGCFSELGCAVIDADVMAHAVLDEPDVLEAMAGRWGDEMLDAAGLVDRGRIAERVFDSQKELDFLNQLVHPRVLERAGVMINACQVDLSVRGIVLDMPLLLEVGWEKKCDFLVFVDCSEDKKWQRIAKNAKIDIEQLKKRENFQISLDKKKQKAHYAIDNNSNKSDIAEQIAQIFSKMMGGSQ